MGNSGIVGGNLLNYILDPDRPYFIAFTALPTYYNRVSNTTF